MCHRTILLICIILFLLTNGYTKIGLPRTSKGGCGPVPVGDPLSPFGYGEEGRAFGTDLDRFTKTSVTCRVSATKRSCEQMF